VQPTSFEPVRPPDPDKRIEFQSFYEDLFGDETRNRRIADGVIDAVTNGRSPLVLTERDAHLDRLEQLLGSDVAHLVVLRLASRCDVPVRSGLEAGLFRSVRRLVRDGVNSPLANLFVHAARPTPPDAEGADRARSATEAFLYRRLETLPETKGRFRLNLRPACPCRGRRQGARLRTRRDPARVEPRALLDINVLRDLATGVMEGYECGCSRRARPRGCSRLCS